MSSHDNSADGIQHKGWVRLSHWIITLSFLALAYTGVVILMAHPRLYWGEAGNDLTPALMELPISRNYKHGGYEDRTPFFQEAGAPITASRTYDIFNKNGWGRSLHFLSAWILVVTGLLYLIAGAITGHFRSRMWPKRSEFSFKQFVNDILGHIRMQIPSASDTAQYNLLQKWSYLAVIFFLLP
jgi:Ni,Fe-hydrogenase I cytochrome b subunit